MHELNAFQENLVYSCKRSKFLLVVIQKLLGSIQRLEDIRKHIPKGIMPATNLKGSPLHARPNQTKAALYRSYGKGKRKRFY